MEQLDERILEHVEESGWGSPPIMHRKFPMTVSIARVRERCRVLTNVGYIAPIVEGTDQYELTSSGKAYLAGESDARQRFQAADTR
jgi:hypothetical protein